MFENQNLPVQWRLITLQELMQFINAFGEDEEVVILDKDLNPLSTSEHNRIFLILGATGV